MILVDTSIWIDHLRQGEPLLIPLLESGTVLIHPWCVGEIALGNLGNRAETLQLLRDMPQAMVVPDSDVLRSIDDLSLSGSGIGYVDAQLLASTLALDGTELWTRDRRLALAARRLHVANEPAELTDAGAAPLAP